MFVKNLKDTKTASDMENFHTVTTEVGQMLKTNKKMSNHCWPKIWTINLEHKSNYPEFGYILLLGPTLWPPQPQPHGLTGRPQ